MNKLIAYFLPKNIEQKNQMTQTKVRYLIFSLIGIGIACICSSSLFYINQITDLLILTFFMLFGGIGLMFLLKYTGKIVLTSFLFGTLSAIYIVAMVYNTGGIHSSFIIWVMTLPIVATIITIRVSLIYYTTFLSISIYVVFLLMKIYGIDTPNIIPEDFSTTYNVIINQMLIMITVVGILIFYYYQNQSYNQQLEVSNESLEKFASVTSHDLKAPLRNIVSFSQLLKRKLQKQPNTDEATFEYVEFIEQNGKKMNDLIQGILAFSKVQSTTEIEVQKVDLNEVLEDVAINLKASIQDNNAVFEYEKMPIIYGNKLQITQVFQNLVGNGLKYNRSETPTVNISYKPSNKQHVFLIKDNGIGIEEGYFDKIFEMFQRLNSVAEFQGTGIGLAICKKIATLHKGDLKVKESSENGTTFKFSLPIVKK